MPTSFLLQLTAAATALVVVSCFSVDSLPTVVKQEDDFASSGPRSLQSLGRRDALVTITTTPLISSLFLTQPALAKDESMNYQAVWFDPNHSNGYKVLFGDDKQAILLVRDEPSSDEQALPVTVISQEGKETKLLFDFSTLGGPSDSEGILTRNSDRIRIISFGKNNGFWINKKFEGPIGVYKDSSNSKRVIIIRQIKGSDCVVEFRDQGGRIMTTFPAKAGSTFVFNNFPGKEKDAEDVTATFSLFRRTLTFDDGTVWTKY